MSAPLVEPSPRRAARPSRRAFLGGVAGGVVAVAGGAAAAAPESDVGASARSRPLALSDEPALHALRRLTYGPTPELVAAVRRSGVRAFIAAQLAPATVPDPTADALLATLPTLSLPAAALRETYADRWQEVVYELQSATVIRALHSNRQLFEMVVELWSNHFSIYAPHERARFLKPTDDRDVIRRFALGRFADLLRASAQSPAMLTFLDQDTSLGRSPNENYARELLELHTVGLDGGYTERDIRNVARLLTGWSVDETTQVFRYDAARHATGAVQVMGFTAANALATSGLSDGVRLLDYLARHPATARHIATKICRRFVSDTPSKSLIESTAKAYLDNDTAIVPVLLHVLTSSEFSASSGAKLRRPLEWLIAGVRALGYRYDPTSPMSGGHPLLSALHQLGQLPFAWRPPDGYPDVGAPWLGTSFTLARWNVAEALASGAVAGLVAAPVPAASGARTAGELVDHITERLLFQQIAPGHRATLLRYLGRSAHAAVTPAYAAHVTPELVALVLDSPYFQQR